MLLYLPLAANAQNTECSGSNDHTQMNHHLITINVAADVQAQFGNTPEALNLLSQIALSAQSHTMLTIIPGLYDGPNGYISEGYDRLAEYASDDGLPNGSYGVYLTLTVHIPSLLDGEIRSIGQGVQVCFEVSDDQTIEESMDESEIETFGLPSDPDRLHFAGSMDGILAEINVLMDPTNPDPTGLLFPPNATIVINGNGGNGNWCGPGTPYDCVYSIAPPGGTGGGMQTIDDKFGDGNGDFP